MKPLKRLAMSLLCLCAPAVAAPAVPKKSPARPATVRKVAVRTPAPPRYVLSVDTGGAELRAVFGTKLYRFNGEARTLLELNDLLDPGANAVRIGWTGVNRRAAFTFIRLDGNRAQVLFRYTLDGALKPPHGALNVAIVRNDDAIGEAILSAFVVKGLVRLTLNGHGLGDYASFERRDVTPYLREGRNILKVQWSKDFGASLPRGQVTLQDGNRELVRWDGRFVPTLSGEQTIAFVYL
ncbi:hypothetical protein [Deinococcus pimensis]|uniref:hypothetical protein n=1 Tax=Deinococcus pimensis TaxID=309888 RepID=UPI0005EB98BD|nr:hypothetical protein [Deinococcus pimensis]